MTPQEKIAAVILVELQRQRETPMNYVGAEQGTSFVTLDGDFDLDKVGEALIDLGHVKVELPAPEPKSWRCFHCGELFTDSHRARDHFGATEDRTPVCQIKASEGGLVRALREAEDECERVHTQLHAESADGLNAMRNNLGRHRIALMAMEETGYERGLSDQARVVAILSRALAWHGDPQRLATTREEWQQEVDEAIRWVRDNPEDGRPSFPSMLGRS